MQPTHTILESRAKWKNTGRVRPPWAVPPQLGQRSVWDFPRPPALLPLARVVRVEAGGRVIAETRAAFQVLETASPPTVYVPPADVEPGVLVQTATRTICEWKGRAVHSDVVVAGRRYADAAWAYLDPFPEFAHLRDWPSFHPARVDRCLLDDEVVEPQAGGYYGGWITRDLAGPFKGEPGSSGW